MLWQPVLTRTVAPAGRIGLVPLSDISAPHALLHDAVDEAFSALRQQVSAETGWDALSSLENAYVPLTSPPTPSIQDDWLYTGRAFAVNPLVLSAGWMTIAREDFSGQTYWRVYLKARYQDGSMGMPLMEQTWDLNSRFAGDTRAYEQGGQVGPALPGYWIDLTELAGRYNWQRLPAWNNWRSFYPSIRFNQFVITDGLAWRQAMDELYPPEALATSTPLPALIPTETDLPKFTPRPVTETPTPTLTLIPTRRPTWTPLATQPAP
jgi:TolB protein